MNLSHCIIIRHHVNKICTKIISSVVVAYRAHNINHIYVKYCQTNIFFPRFFPFFSYLMLIFFATNDARYCIYADTFANIKSQLAVTSKTVQFSCDVSQLNFSFVVCFFFVAPSRSRTHDSRTSRARRIDNVLLIGPAVCHGLAYFVIRMRCRKKLHL